MNADLAKMAAEAKTDINYMLVAYRNPVIDTWTIPQPVQGIGEEAEQAFIVATKRACLLGQVKPENIGMEAWLLATYADGTGSINVLDKPKLLVTLTIPSDTPALGKVAA